MSHSNRPSREWDGILDIFLQNVPERIEALTSAVAAVDAAELAKAAHAFKSPCAAIGALGLAGLLQEIELAANDGNMDRAAAGFERLIPEVDTVLLELRKHMASGPNS